VRVDPAELNSIADIAADRAGVLHLRPADPSRRRLQPVEGGRQFDAVQVRPSRQRADTPMIACVGDAGQVGNRGNVQNIVVKRQPDARGIIIGAARQQDAGARCQRIERVFYGLRAQITAHGRTPHKPPPRNKPGAAFIVRMRID
jgi:hypothetical protein